MATWGATLGGIAEAGGFKGASAIGSGFDALTDWRASQEDKAITQSRWNIQNAKDRWAMEAYVQDKQEKNALKHKLLTQSENLKSATAQINEFFGQPYAPTRAEVMQDVTDLSAQYKGEILRLAELTDSTATAKRMKDLGGADSQTSYNAISQDTVREYGPRLLEAINRAKEDAISIATSNMKLDADSREAYINAYANPYGEQFERESGLLPTGKDGAMPSLGGGTVAYDSAVKSDKAFSDSVTDFGERVSSILRNQNADKEDATTFTGNINSANSDDGYATDYQGE